MRSWDADVALYGNPTPLAGGGQGTASAWAMAHPNPSRCGPCRSRFRRPASPFDAFRAVGFFVIVSAFRRFRRNGDRQADVCRFSSLAMLAGRNARERCGVDACQPPNGAPHLWDRSVVGEERGRYLCGGRAGKLSGGSPAAARCSSTRPRQRNGNQMDQRVMAPWGRSAAGPDRWEMPDTASAPSTIAPGLRLVGAQTGPPREGPPRPAGASSRWLWHRTDRSRRRDGGKWQLRAGRRRLPAGGRMLQSEAG